MVTLRKGEWEMWIHLGTKDIEFWSELLLCAHSHWFIQTSSSGFQIVANYFSRQTSFLLVQRKKKSPNKQKTNVWSHHSLFRREASIQNFYFNHCFHLPQDEQAFFILCCSWQYFLAVFALMWNLAAVWRLCRQGRKNFISPVIKKQNAHRKQINSRIIFIKWFDLKNIFFHWTFGCVLFIYAEETDGGTLGWVAQSSQTVLQCNDRVWETVLLKEPSGLRTAGWDRLFSCLKVGGTGEPRCSDDTPQLEKKWRWSSTCALPQLLPSSAAFIFFNALFSIKLASLLYRSVSRSCSSSLCCSYECTLTVVIRVIGYLWQACVEWWRAAENVMFCISLVMADRN